MQSAELAVPAPAADQADGLRRLFTRRAPGLLALSGAQPRDFASLALDLAGLGERAGRRVLILDLTRGALTPEMGCTAQGGAMRYELMHVLDAHKRLEDVVASGPGGVPLLPAARGLRALAGAWRGRSRFGDVIERAGGAPQLVLAVAPANELQVLAQLSAFAALVVVGPDGGADLAACYAALKRAHAASSVRPRLVYGDGLDAGAARRAHARLTETALSFLGCEPELLGRLTAPQGPDRPRAAVQQDFPHLSVDQLSRAIAGWALPRTSAGASAPVAFAARARRETALDPRT